MARCPVVMDNVLPDPIHVLHYCNLTSGHLSSHHCLCGVDYEPARVVGPFNRQTLPTPTKGSPVPTDKPPQNEDHLTRQIEGILRQVVPIGTHPGSGSVQDTATKIVRVVRRYQQQLVVRQQLFDVLTRFHALTDDDALVRDITDELLDTFTIEKPGDS